MDFITQLFSALNTADSWKVLAFLFIAFLIGWLFAWLYYRRRIGALQDALDRKIAEYSALRAQYDAKIEALALKEADLKKANLEIEELYARIKRLESEKGQLHADLFAAKERIAQLEAELAAKAELDVKHLANIDALNNQILGLQTKVRDAESKAVYGASLTTEVDGLKEERDRLNGIILNLNGKLGELDGLRAERDRLASEVFALNDRLEEIPIFRNENDNLHVAISNLEAQLNDCHDRNGALVGLEAENDQLKAEISDLRTGMALAAAPSSDGENADTGKAALALAEVKAALGSKIAAATADEKDDLKRINGIGPFIENKLNNIGIYTFEQISQFDGDMVEKVTDAIEFFPGRIDRDDWVGQAKRLLGMKLAGTLDTEVRLPQPDDLKIVEGIGPKIEQLLKNAGIDTWKDLAASSTERLQDILHAAGERFRIHNPTTWPEQARMAHAGEWDRLKEYQDYLIGGRDLGNKD
jgi:predicted flap endonuclease-1-like 5' DNA nuclease